MPMDNLIEYIDHYLKASGYSWQYYRDKPDAAIENSESFKSEIRIIGKTSAAGNPKMLK